MKIADGKSTPRVKMVEHRLAGKSVGEGQDLVRGDGTSQPGDAEIAASFDEGDAAQTFRGAPRAVAAGAEEGLLDLIIRMQAVEPRKDLVRIWRRPCGYAVQSLGGGISGDGVDGRYLGDAVVRVGRKENALGVGNEGPVWRGGGRGEKTVLGGGTRGTVWNVLVGDGSMTGFKGGVESERRRRSWVARGNVCRLGDDSRGHVAKVVRRSTNEVG